MTSTRHATQNSNRLRDLRAAIDGTLADPEADDRRVLLGYVLGEASSAASKRKPRERAAKASGRGRKG